MNYRLVWFEHIFTILMKWDWVQVLKLSIPNTRLTNRFKIMIYLDAILYIQYHKSKVSNNTCRYSLLLKKDNLCFCKPMEMSKKNLLVQLIICSKFLVNITVNNCKVLYNVKQINLIHIEPFKQELGLSVGCYYLICLSKTSCQILTFFQLKIYSPGWSVIAFNVYKLYIISRWQDS